MITSSIIHYPQPNSRARQILGERSRARSLRYTIPSRTDLPAERLPAHARIASTCLREFGKCGSSGCSPSHHQQRLVVEAKPCGRCTELAGRMDQVRQRPDQLGVFVRVEAGYPFPLDSVFIRVHGLNLPLLPAITTRIAIKANDGATRAPQQSAVGFAESPWPALPLLCSGITLFLVRSPSVRAEP